MTARNHPPTRSFMHPDEMRSLRMNVLHVSQRELATQMISPFNGYPIAHYTVCKWERALIPVPLWAARRMRELAGTAKKVKEELETVDKWWEGSQ